MNAHAQKSVENNLLNLMASVNIPEPEKSVNF